MPAGRCSSNLFTLWESSATTWLSWVGGSRRSCSRMPRSRTSARVREGLSKIRKAFLSVDHVGPKWVADFLEIADTEERAIIQRRAYELVTSWLDELKIDA